MSQDTDVLTKEHSQATTPSPAEERGGGGGGDVSAKALDQARAEESTPSPAACDEPVCYDGK